MIARFAAVTALLGAIVLIALLLLFGGSQYTLRADFQDAGGLVAGDQVLIGPSVVGTVKSIGLTKDGAAEVKLALDSSAAPAPQGTIARIYENSLSGLASRYVVLEPGPRDAPRIPDGGVIDEEHTRSIVGLDQLFDTLDPQTRAGLKNFIRGQAASIDGRATAANRTLRYFAPALASTSDVTAELARDEPTFDSMLVQGADALQTLGSSSQELTQLVAHTSAAMAAIAGQSQALEQALTLLPGALNHSTSTFAGLRSTLDALDPLVAKSKPAVRRLAAFSRALRIFAETSAPTLGQLSALIRNPTGRGDLTALLLATPALQRLAAIAFPRQVQVMNDSQAQLDYLREYTPDVVAALTNLGQASAYYDANGHYVRTNPVFGAFSLNGLNQLTPLPAFATRYTGLQVVQGRCPGGAVQPPPDASAPWLVPGCNPSTTPPGP